MMDQLLELFHGWATGDAAFVISFAAICLVVAAVVLVCRANDADDRFPQIMMICGIFAVALLVMFVISPLNDHGNECVRLQAVVTAENLTENTEITKCRTRLIGEPWGEWRMVR